MRTVHKYVLTETRNQVPTYERARIVHVAVQHEQIAVWAEVNTLAHECMRTLHVVGTGGEIPEGTTYVGSLLADEGRYVFHIYDEGDS